jgi:putative membrane-bound dehydrogenase-like protein
MYSVPQFVQRAVVTAFVVGLIVQFSRAADPVGPPADKRRDGNRLAYLDENNPWYPHRDFPKLITPQWVGEEGVECVVVLAIDDMREPAKYEAYLRPILNRLKQIDGRAPVSIMTCNVKPDDPQLAAWLAEGLSLEVHTIDHPCPLLQGGDFAKAKSTYDHCVDLMNEIPGNKPVAFRMPCCDSLNTLSPRFYAEIFNKTTAKGNFLAISSSVFNLFTPNDPTIPRELVVDRDGRDKFRKYLPKGLVRDGQTFNTFTNYIEDYPYPYIVNRLCWEFPCVVPSDWSAQHLQKPNNPDTVRDLKAALDITVMKQGVFNLVFHPHNWIKPEQIVEIIDHAVTKHGKKVKFLTFREALERLNKNVLFERPLRGNAGAGISARLADVNADGYQDVVFHLPAGNTNVKPATRVWSARSVRWDDLGCPVDELPRQTQDGLLRYGPLLRSEFGVFGEDRLPSVFNHTFFDGGWHVFSFDAGGWFDKPAFVPEQLPKNPIRYSCRDLNGDGITEVIRLHPDREKIRLYKWSVARNLWDALPFQFPEKVWGLEPDYLGDAGLRFVDIDEDGRDDIVFSNAERFGVYLFNDMQTGWSRVVVEGTRSDNTANVGRKPDGGTEASKAVTPAQRDVTPPGPPLRRGGEASRFEIPPIVRADGTDNGFFVHSRHLFWQNEDTAKVPDLVDRRSFNEILAQAPDLPPRAKSPEAALHTIRARPGFAVELMAAEPLVFDPISFAFGPDGKLWVVEMGDYPLGITEREKADTRRASPAAKRGGGEIRCLQDSDADGKYDKASLFLEIPFPTGVLPWGQGALVLAPPDLLYAEDTDGDGQADKREVLYTGFAEGNQQHRANGLVYGLDNWIYIANGDSGGMIESKKTGKKVSINGRDLRVHPQTGDLDAVTGQTQFGRSRDDWGNWFGCNNSNPMYQFVLDDAAQRRNPHFAGTSPRIDVPEVAGNAPVYPISPLLERFNDFHTANRFTSACSAMIYRDDLFGPHFAGNAFICEPVHNLVHREVVSPTGVTFTSRRAADEEQSEFLASSDNWFRPTTVKTGPDGALWIADMYRHVIEHPQWIPDTWQKKLDLRAGHDKGRLYRVFPVDKKPRAIPRLDKMSTADLVAALDSPSGWQRDMAQQLLVARKDQIAIGLLEQQVVSGKRPETRVQALCTLDGLGRLLESRRILVRALSDSHPAVRRHAVRLGGPILAGAEDYLTKLVELAKDPDPQVRLQLAYTLGDLTGPEEVVKGYAGATIGKMLVADGGDRFIFSALMSSVNDKNVEAVLTAVLAAGRNSPLNENLIVNLLDLAAALGDDQALATLVLHVTHEQSGEPAIWQFAALARLVESLARRNETLADKIRKSRLPGTEQLLMGIDRIFAAARSQAANNSADLELRSAAVRLLGRGRDQRDTDLKLLGTLLTPQTPPELQEAAIAALGRLRDESIPSLVIAHWRGLVAARRTQALDALMSRDAWAAELVAAIGDDQVPRTDFDAARRQRLLNHRSLDVRNKASAAFATAGNADRQKVIDQYSAALASPADPLHGAQLFAKVCATCHRLAGIGHEVGPDLASLTDKAPEALLIAVLDPNRAVESKFLTYVAETKSGSTFSGLLASETGNSITLVNAERKEQVILRADLEELVSTSKSVMPEGIEKDLSPRDVADIIAHVRSNVPLPVRKEFVGNDPQLVHPADDGSLLLSSATCEIYGPTLIFEPQYQNLGYWSSADDQAVWHVDVVHAGQYAVEFDWACDGSVQGNPWQIVAGGKTITGRAESTGNWDTYRRAKVGEVTLSAGKQRIVMSAGSKPQGALIDLKSITLTPVKKP